MLLARFIILICLLFIPAISMAESAVDYPIVYVRAPREGDDTHMHWAEVFNPVRVPRDTDLMILFPDGTEEVLVDAEPHEAIIDPYVSFDGNWVYYVKFHNVDDHNSQRGASRAGSDIYRINVETKEIVRLTFQDWTPPSGTARWSSNHLTADQPGQYHLGYGVFNLGPCPLPDGKVIFTSSRNGFLPAKGFTVTNQQLFVMDDDGTNIQQTGYLNVGAALHPTVMTNGEVLFSSYEMQGVRDRRVWGLWSIYPDGRQWKPRMSAFQGPTAFHFQTQLSDGTIAVAEYYNKNNWGFGTILGFDAEPRDKSLPAFGSPINTHPSNPLVRRGRWRLDPSHSNYLAPRFRQYSFSPQGLHAITGFSHAGDSASSPDSSGNFAGKATHPSGAPGNDLLITYSRGPVNVLSRPVSLPAADGDIAVIKGGGSVDDIEDPRFVVLQTDPNYNAQQPRALVSYEEIYGVKEPKKLPWLPNDGKESPDLPKGTPHGIVGTSSFYKRDTAPNLLRGGPTPLTQMGGDVGTYDASEIHAVRIISMEPEVHRSYGPGMTNAKILGFENMAGERLRIMGEIPLRKFTSSGQPVMDPDGNPDTSFAAKFPADVPFTFQTIDKQGRALNISQTWHQLRPGEIRNDCGGCHAHSQKPTLFESTAAARPDYELRDLTKSIPILAFDRNGNSTVSERDGALDVEFSRDIKPIIERSCVGCHKGGAPAGGLALDENPYRVLLGEDGTGTEYVLPFRSRLSKLIWKIFGERSDGSEQSLEGSVMPPIGASVPPVTKAEKLQFARWVDLGAPRTKDDEANIAWRSENWGWFMDALRPTVAISSPRAGRNDPGLSEIRLGLFDYYSGLDMSSLSVTADFPVGGNAPGTELGDQFTQSGDDIWTLSLGNSIEQLEDGLIVVEVRDQQGNWTTIRRTFSVSTDPKGDDGSSSSPNDELPTGDNDTEDEASDDDANRVGVCNDLDGDGISEIIASHGRNAHSVVYASAQDHVAELATDARSLFVGNYTLGSESEIALLTGKRKVSWTVLDTDGSILQRFRFGKASDRLLGGCDFDGDGYVDPAAISKKRGVLKAKLSTTRTIGKLRIATGRARVMDASCVDLDNDGIDEIAVILRGGLVGSSITRKAARIVRVLTIQGDELVAREIKGARDLISMESLSSTGVLGVASPGGRGFRSIGIFSGAQLNQMSSIRVSAYRDIASGLFRINGEDVEPAILMVRKSGDVDLHGTVTGSIGVHSRSGGAASKVTELSSCRGSVVLKKERQRANSH